MDDDVIQIVLVTVACADQGSGSTLAMPGQKRTIIECKKRDGSRARAWCM